MNTGASILLMLVSVQKGYRTWRTNGGGWDLSEKISGLNSPILQPCHTVQHDPCNLPLLRGAQRFPAGRTAAAVLYLRVCARGDGQAHDRGARDTAHRGRAGAAQRRVGGPRAGDLRR